MNDKYYYKDGSILDCRDISKILHREDGPAIELADGTKEWWINGKQVYGLIKRQLIRYMEANKYNIKHLLTDPDDVVRKSTEKYIEKNSNLILEDRIQKILDKVPFCGDNIITDWSVGNADMDIDRSDINFMNESPSEYNWSIDSIEEIIKSDLANALLSPAPYIRRFAQLIKEKESKKI